MGQGIQLEMVSFQHLEQVTIMPAFAGADLAATIELPGGGSYGFNLPAERIAPVVQETWVGFEELFEYIAETYPVP